MPRLMTSMQAVLNGAQRDILVEAQRLPVQASSVGTASISLQTPAKPSTPDITLGEKLSVSPMPDKLISDKSDQVSEINVMSNLVHWSTRLRNQTNQIHKLANLSG